MQEEIVKLAIYLAPMYFANSSAFLLGGKTPIDFGKKLYDNKPILGRGKTIRGFVFGVLAGTLAAFIISIALPEQTALLSNDYVLLGFLLALGAVIGDLVASFFKRRHGIEQGQEVLFLDQLDFAIGAMIVGSFLYAPSFYEIIAVGFVTLAAHKVANIIAFKAKLKKVPW